MLFCITVNYAPHVLGGLMDKPQTNRAAAISKLLEAAGGKLVALYSTIGEGPGAMVICDLPDGITAAAIGGVVVASGSVRDYKMTRLISPEEVVEVRGKAAKLRRAYKPAG